MSKNHYSINLASIDIEGEDRAFAESVELEIRTVLEPILSVDLGLVQDVKLSVVLSNNMGEAVDRVTAAYGKAVVAPYQPVRRSVQAAGIVITGPNGPPVDATAVFDIDPWTRQTPEDIAIRVYLLGHEYGHVLQKGRGTGLKWERSPDEVRTHTSEIRRAAQVMRDEFDADLTADSVCKCCLHNNDGQPVPPALFFGHRFAESANELLGALCAFVSVDVQMYRVSAIGLADLYPKAGTLVGELMLVLTHAAALYAGAGDTKPLSESLAVCPGFAEYFADDWHAFLQALTAEDATEGEAELMRITETVLDRVGLVVEDTEDGGLYVHVHEPVMCELTEGSD